MRWRVLKLNRLTRFPWMSPMTGSGIRLHFFLLVSICLTPPGDSVGLCTPTITAWAQLLPLILLPDISNVPFEGTPGKVRPGMSDCDSFKAGFVVSVGHCLLGMPQNKGVSAAPQVG